MKTIDELSIGNDLVLKDRVDGNLVYACILGEKKNHWKVKFIITGERCHTYSVYKKKLRSMGKKNVLKFRIPTDQEHKDEIQACSKFGAAKELFIETGLKPETLKEFYKIIYNDRS